MESSVQKHYGQNKGKWDLNSVLHSLSSSECSQAPPLLFSFSGRWWFRSWFPVASGWARVPLLARSACVLVAPAPALPAPRPCSAAPAEVGSEGEVVPCPAPPGHGRDSVCTPSVRGWRPLRAPGPGTPNQVRGCRAVGVVLWLTQGATGVGTCSARPLLCVKEHPSVGWRGRQTPTPTAFSLDHILMQLWPPIFFFPVHTMP